MAFLDNSGDIILDAVLTEEGRRRMSTGNFQISKFAFGDDEINYGLYNKSHASGSAYYDLEILQTPIFQANTGINAGINYGLLSFTNTNLLYFPAIRRNTKINLAALLTDKVYYLAVKDGQTYDALVTGFGGAKGGGNQRVMGEGRHVRGSTAFIILETGLDTSEISATPANKSNYIISQGLQDSSFLVSVDTKFISKVFGPSANSTFSTEPGTGDVAENISLTSAPISIPDPDRLDYRKANCRAINNNVYYRINDQKLDTQTSSIKGPRASVLALNFQVKVIADDVWTKYGKTGQTISGPAGTYKYIDTTVKVESTTGLVEQLPIRIIQKE